MEHKTVMLPLDMIRVDDTFNCRGEISMPSIVELAHNIRAQGLLQPVVVGAVEEDGKRLLIAGYRRFKATKYLKQTEIFAVLRDDLVDHNKLLLVNLHENLQRSNLNIIQEGEAIQRLLDADYTMSALPKLLNRMPIWIEGRLQAIKLPPQLHKDIISGLFTQRHVKELYKSMVTKTTDEFIADVQYLKDGKYKGKKDVSLSDREKELKKEKGASTRSRAEVYKMQKQVSNALGVSNLTTMVLGWANGHVTGADVEIAIKATANGEDLADFKNACILHEKLFKDNLESGLAPENACKKATIEVLEDTGIDLSDGYN